MSFPRRLSNTPRAPPLYIQTYFATIFPSPNRAGVLAVLLVCCFGCQWAGERKIPGIWVMPCFYFHFYASVFKLKALCAVVRLCCTVLSLSLVSHRGKEYSHYWKLYRRSYKK